MAQFDIPYVQVRHGCLLFYTQPDFPPSKSSEFPKLKAYSGTVTKGSQKRIRQAVDILLQTSPKQRIFNTVTSKWQNFTLNFVTLTIAQEKPVTAEEAYTNCLKEWLRKMRQKHGLTSYIWKAELQERGQLHYHLTANVFLHHSTIREVWNRQQKKAGYLDDYAKKHKHFNANSTDVHAVWKVKNIEAYLTKYLSKTSQNEVPTKGKVWDCSKDLKRKRFSTEATSELWDKCVTEWEKGKAEKVMLDHCTIFKIQNPERLLDQSQRTAYAKWK